MQAEVNFINLFERFWQVAPETEGFKSDYAALYFALIDSINRNSEGKVWKETDIEYDRIINKVRMGKRMFLEARSWLVQHQFLTYTPGRNEYSKARYFICIEVQKCTATVTTTATTSDTTTATTTDTAGVTEYIEKPLNLKTLNLETNILANARSEDEKREGVSLKPEKEKAPHVAAGPPAKPKKAQPEPVIPEDWTTERRDALLTWLHYKTQRKEFYVEDGLRALITKLSKYSDYVVDKSIQDSMSNGWKGLFPEKIQDHANGTHYSNANGTYPNSRPAASQPGPNRKVTPKVDLEAALRRRSSSNGSQAEQSVSDADWRYVDEPVVPARP